ncbi:MFS transporter [Flindersiella endophytica]
MNRLSMFVQPFLVLYLTQDRGLSAATAGLVAASVGVGNAVAQLLGGFLADRVGRRITMLIGFFGTAVTMIGLGTSSGLPRIVVFSLLVGVASELFRPAAAATVADVVPPEGRVRAYGLLFWAINLGFAVATSSAGFLASQGFGLLFWIDAAGSALAGLIIWRMVPETRPIAKGERPRSLLRVAGRDRTMLALSAISAGYAVLYLQAYATLPLSMTADGLPASVYGVVIALNGIVIVLIQPFLVSRLGRYDRSRVLAGAYVLVGLGFAGMALVSEPIGYGATVVVWTLGEIGFAAVSFALYADLAPIDLRGGYMGIGALTFSLGAVLGPIAGTYVFEHGGKAMLGVACLLLTAVIAGAQLALRPALVRRTATVQAVTV